MIGGQGEDFCVKNGSLQRNSTAVSQAVQLLYLICSSLDWGNFFMS
ncbi:hypothetical protein ACFX4W_08295 [Priestia sp. YIM B13489]